MKAIKNIGLVLFILGLCIFTASTFFGTFTVKHSVISAEIEQLVIYGKIKSEVSQGLIEAYKPIDNVEYSNPLAFSEALITIYDNYKSTLSGDKDMIVETSKFVSSIGQQASSGIFATHTWWMFFLTFGLAIIGGLMFTLPNIILLGSAGIKNDHVFQDSATNRGWIGFLVFGYLVSFYVILYFFHHLLINQIALVSPISEGLSGNKSTHWFLYGFMYCSTMSVMAVRMFVKYRHNRYQMLRTAVVLFFQIAFAFLIPEILVRFNMPYMDLKNAWPLDYDFFYSYNIDELASKGLVGTAMLIWGVLLTLVVVPVMVYFYGKRWYCSWVCGCGGLAETLGDPYRQLSSKKISSWKLERWLIHGVLGFAILMTFIVIGAYVTKSDSFLGIPTYVLTMSYGFLIGSVFSGIIGTGFYPILGNRSWCRFGCPLAAYMGLIQRFKSRFRITTNGGQCISCGNCSTYCEQGIDVRWYAQRGQNIVRSSCVGCGVCSAVCPRGVLNLENGPEEGRINDLPIIIGDRNIKLKEE